MADGTGRSLGEALVNAIAAEAGGSVGRKTSYQAKHWHAQLSKLTDTRGGWTALEKAGVSATPRTLRNWLGDAEYPIRRGDRDKIAAAFEIAAGKWPKAVETRQVDIRGQVGTGGDARIRGEGRSAPLRVQGQAGSWSQMREAWNQGDVDPSQFEEWFIDDVLVADIGEGSDGWDFAGGAYTVSI